MVVNGVSWPFLSVEPERYRFRLLNGCNSRVLNLSLVALGRNGRVLGEVPFYQIGSEQGLLPDVVRIVTGQAVALPGDGSEPALPTVFPAPGTAPALLMGLAERADVIVDFSNLPVGTVRVRMLNTASTPRSAASPTSRLTLQPPAKSWISSWWPITRSRWTTARRREA